jgi:hypothetical protein
MPLGLLCQLIRESMSQQLEADDPNVIILAHLLGCSVMFSENCKGWHFMSGNSVSFQPLKSSFK